jgi:hypothetical protein
MSAGVVCQGLVSGGLRFASDFAACLRTSLLPVASGGESGAGFEGSGLLSGFQRMSLFFLPPAFDSACLSLQAGSQGLDSGVSRFTPDFNACPCLPVLLVFLRARQLVIGQKVWIATNLVKTSTFRKHEAFLHALPIAFVKSNPSFNRWSAKCFIMPTFREWRPPNKIEFSTILD